MRIEIREAENGWVITVIGNGKVVDYVAANHGEVLTIINRILGENAT